MSRRSILAAAALAWSAVAGPTLTTVQDVLYKADGTRFNGTLVISWRSFQTADNSAIVPQSTTVKVVDGYLKVQLVPTTTTTPAATYTVTYNSDGRTQFREIWAVPPSSVALRVRDVRTSTVSTGSSSGSAANDTTITLPINESDVNGLPADLTARPVKGPDYAASRVAVVDSSGLLVSASGDPSDCVRVDGSTVPCGTGGPTFVDGEVPAGLADGANTSFGLAGVPSPAASLAVYRNGVLQKVTQDYTLSGSTIQFVTAAAPQAGDTLLVSYRTAGVDTSSTTVTPVQVLCSGTGTSTNSTTLTTLGTCVIAAGVLLVGDRVEIRFDLAHQGATAGFSLELHWGNTTVVHRDAGASETVVSGRADAVVLAASAQTSSLSWGTSLALTATAGTASDSYAGGLTVSLLGLVSSAADTLVLNNFTVLRIP